MIMADEGIGLSEDGVLRDRSTEKITGKVSSWRAHRVSAVTKAHVTKAQEP